MLIAIDIGNTSIKFGVFDHKELLYQGKVNANETLPKDILAKYSVKKAIYCATGQVTGVMMAQIKGFEHYHELTHETPIPVQSKYMTPSTLGRDRIAAVCGAFEAYPSQNVLIIDAGTCITYEVLTKDGIYLGGNIAPGLKMRIQAMHEFTAKLPIVPLSLPTELIGRQTETALQNGAVRGSLLEIVEFRSRVKRKIGVLTTVLTGGDADFLDNNLKIKTFVNRTLVLHGLQAIYSFNFLRKQN